VNSVGAGAASGEVSVTPATQPGAPQGLSAAPGDATVSLTWSPPSSNGGSPITNYRVYRGFTSGGETLLTTLGVVTSYSDTAVTNGVTYYYEVSALNNVGEGPRSSEASATPVAPPTVPGAPRDLGAVAGDATVALVWSSPSADGGSPITQYKIYRGTTSGGETLQPPIGNVLTYSDTSVTNGVAYYYYVTAVNVNGESGSSNEVSAMPVAGPSVPGAPRNLVATPGNGTMTLTWSPPPWDVRSPITGYTVYRGTNSGNRSFSVLLGNVTTYTDTGLANGQRYYYVVTAINAIGEGPPSSEVSAKPATVPGSPGNLQAIPGNGNVTIQWSGAANNGAPVTN